MQGKRHHKIYILLILVSVLVGCSSLKLSYRFLDNAIRWKINDYVTLNAEQGITVTRGINQFHRWHQQTQLRVYAEFMGKKAVQLQATTLTPSDFNNIYNDAFDLITPSMDELVPVISDMLLSLKQEQILSVIRNMEKQSARDLKEDFSITREQRLKKRQNKMIRRVAKWIGRLNKEQIAIIAKWAAELPVDEKVRVERQERFVSGLKKQFRDRSNPEQFKRRVLIQVKTPEKFSGVAYKASFNKRKQLTFTLLSDLFNSLTAMQKSRLITSVKKYQIDFLSLAPKVVN